MARSAFRRLRDVSADVGWRELLRIGPQWLVCRRYLGFTADLRALGPGPPSPPELRITDLEPDDAPALRTLDDAMTRQEVMRRLDESQRCTLGWWNGQLAHARWDAAGPVRLPYLGRVLRPGRGDQIVVGVYTAPAFRGRGIADAVMRETARRARAAGVSRWMWLVAWWNAPSLVLAHRFPSRAQGTIGYWRLGPCRSYFASGGIRLEPDGAFRIDEVVTDREASMRERGARLTASDREEDA
jgi:GNAT superfamily N-acetyltransferase